MMRSFCISILSLIVIGTSFEVLGQQPLVNSLSKYSAPAGEVITINGTGLNSTPQVNFGAGIATIIEATATQIKVTVPSTATYAPVTVTNTTTGLSSSSTRPFIMSFGGSSDLDSANFDDQVIENRTGKLIWDVCLCDLDGDKDLDVASTFRESPNLSFFRNADAGNTDNLVAFSTPPLDNLAVNANTDMIVCEDLDGNGTSDIIMSTVLSTATFHVKIYPNTGGDFTLGTFTSFRLPNKADGNNRSARTINVVDIDRDGKKDLVIGNGEDNFLFIYRNTTTSFNDIQFTTTPYSLQIGDLINTMLIDDGELNGDGLPDLAVTSDQAGQIALLKNESSPGLIRFADPVIVGNSVSKTVMKLADFDNDGLHDLAYASFNSGKVVTLRSTTTSMSADLSMAAATSADYTQVYGLDIGDLNGDGLADIATTSLTNGVRLYTNSTAGNAISFVSGEQIDVNLLGGGQNTGRNIRIADVNSDGKPDLVFAFNSRTGLDGQLSIIANRSCIDPVIIPEEIESYCDAQSFYLTAPQATDASYSWSRTAGDGTISFNSGGNTSSDKDVEVLVTGATVAQQIQLEITYTGESCSPTTTTQSFNLQTVSSPEAIISEPGGPYCSGDNITLSSTNTADNYYWTLPNGSTVNTQSINITDAGPEDAGQYILRVLDNNECPTDPDTLFLDIEIPPSLTITNENGGDYFCEGNAITLAVPNYAGFSYQWYEGGAPVTDSTNATINVLDSGVYTLELTSNANSCVTTTESFEVYAIDAPSAILNGTAAICVNLEQTFEATSTGNSNFTMTHSWDFKDGTTASGASVVHTFTSAGTYDVELTSSYDDIEMCEDILTFQVTVTEIPTINITAPSGLEKCASDSTRLELPQNYQSYLWSTGDTTYFTYAKTNLDETSVTVSADVVTDVGCATTTESITISNFEGSGMTITSSDATIENNTLSLEAGVKSVSLTASVNTETTYNWSASDASVLSDTTGATITVFPKEASTSVTATAIGSNDCVETRTITILRPGLQPRKSFSPNGDGLNDCWEIVNSENVNGCKLYIFDSRGRVVYEADSPFIDNCAWDGNITGSNKPYTGMYYFVLKCQDNSSNQSGSILLAR